MIASVGVDPCFNLPDDAADIPEGFNTKGRSLRLFMFVRICSTSLKTRFQLLTDAEFLPALRDLLIILPPLLHRFRRLLVHLIPRSAVEVFRRFLIQNASRLAALNTGPLPALRLRLAVAFALDPRNRRSCAKKSLTS